jgi:hypothetical protein
MEVELELLDAVVVVELELVEEALEEMLNVAILPPL